MEQIVPGAWNDCFGFVVSTRWHYICHALAMDVYQKKLLEKGIKIIVLFLLQVFSRVSLGLYTKCRNSDEIIPLFYALFQAPVLLVYFLLFLLFFGGRPKGQDNARPLRAVFSKGIIFEGGEGWKSICQTTSAVVYKNLTP